MFRLVALSLTTLALTACSGFTSDSTETKVRHFYDYQLYSPVLEPISLTSLPKSLLEADVILVGEWHTHSGIHRFQTDLLDALSDQRPVALSMEQFTRDKQTVVDHYLAGKIGEQFLIKSGNAWPNYESDYRPLVELAKQKQLDVIAANAPKPIVRCIGREGIEYLEVLPPHKRDYVAADINTADSPYKEKFMASMHHGSPEQTQNQYAAQVTWDETMAESITNYLTEHSGTQVLHIAGKFHTEQGLGTKASILKRNPSLNVVVITPYSNPEDNNPNSDFVLNVLPPPERYVQMEHRMAAYQHLSKRDDTLKCI
ncbi:hypothetical protein EJ063_11910 [Vibrio aquaticus]|uniref:Haem-binding uptake Tiki superfamily ChaN domain-containing protein n=1 Tax=Vibrio aquaticus TaxID=2496559 RepID=A0A3S0PND8_9VIBR|nr:ChaN family lipoprotein [Vibrio aquaticus]RTZ15772.1 hypothetical protein EJ063_11910 [Vibrio aquaticus]